MSNFAKYIFAPWVRQGLSNNINEEDSLGDSGVTTTAVERAEIAIQLNWTGDAIEKTAQLLGPGDIKSISEEAILKMSPLPFSRDLESNYLPFIEFYEEDFPWRYTPAKPKDNVSPTEKTRLRPWLALVVLEDKNGDDDAEFTFFPGDGPLPYITVTPDVSTVFHPADENWAWAHVQYNPDESTTVSTNQALLDKIIADPDRSLSRILCPRKLEKSKNYRAFLIPAFETGRLAGLGEEISGVLAQTPSWDNTGTPRPQDFPVYKEWGFRTSEDGDFEALAKKLKPKVFDGSGGRDLAIEDPGYGVQYKVGGVLTNKNAKLEGALKPTDATENAWPVDTDDDAYVLELSNVLNLNSSLNPTDGTSQSATLSDNPFSNTDILDDPIVTPPVYGQWHFLDSSLPPALPVSGTNKWFSQVNLNPAWRAAAGIGTKIVRENQEAFMERAWLQVGEINKANEAIRLAELMKWTNKRIRDKRVKPVPTERFMKMNSSLMKRVQSTGGKSLFGELTESELPNAVMDNGFRKMTRSRGTVARKASKAVGYAHPNELIETIVTTFNGVEGVAEASATKAAIPFAPESTVPAPASSPALTTLESEIMAFSEPVPPKFDFDDIASGARVKIEQRADPFYQVSRADGYSVSGNLSVLDRKIVSQVELLNDAGTAWSPVEDRRPIMAYPKFDDILGDYVKEIDVEYILPEVNKVEENSVTLMKTNPKFIESIFLGINHEMSRELLWREFPTDQRGTYFRQFWDKKDVIDPGASIEDIEKINEWAANLGDNTTTGDGGDSLVLVIKGDLLKKFPDAIIYAQKAAAPTIGDGITESAPFKRTDDALPLDPATKKHPIFSLTLSPDITIVGFDLTADEAQNNLEVVEATGATTGDPGWYFVFAERPGKPRFGLDENETTMSELESWSDLEWADLGASPTHIPLTPVITLDAGSPAPDADIPWAASAAEMAYITFQKPALVAIHAEKMLPYTS